jgi:hypothetical protein
MTDEMPSGYGNLRSTAERIWHQVFCRAVQRSHLHKNSTILLVKYWCILNATPYLQMHLGALEHALHGFRAQCSAQGGQGAF